MQGNIKQADYPLENGIIFSSKFESGNLGKVQHKDNQTYYLWIQGDPFSTYRTWFYFSVDKVPQGMTVTFVFQNMSNQVKLFKEGHLPVFCIENQKKWGRITQPIQQNGVAKGQEGFLLTFKHTFTSKSKHFFAFSYPWTYSENNLMIRAFVDKFKDNYFCDYRRLCLTTKKAQLNILTVTQVKENHSVSIRAIKRLDEFECYTFPAKKGIFVSARVHPGEVAASHMCNGFIKYLFSVTPQAELLLQNFVFYIVPIINPDGVIDGNFRCDSLGKNLNRYYTDPSPVQQPEIFSIKTFLVEMIKAKLINFCLDLHAHVNKQGAFIYGNSSGSLKQQLQVCLFPKLLEYNSKFFDYESCNFSEKNMTSKDKGDSLSKEGASRVAIYKDTGLARCWTLQCNYNSAKVLNVRPKACQEEPNSKVISNGVLMQINSPPKKDELLLLNVTQFEELGANVAETILDYYGLRKTAPYFASRLKNSTNFQLSLALNMLRMIPFRFDNDCRKLINAINSSQCLNENFGKILEKIGLDSVHQYLSSKSVREKSFSKRKDSQRVQSLRTITGNPSIEKIENAKREVNKTSMGQKEKKEVKRTILMPNVPKMPRKK